MQGRGNFIQNAGKSSPCISHLKRALHCTLQGLKRNFQLIGFVQIFPDKDYSSRCSCKNKQQGAAINTLKSTQQKYAARAPKMPNSSKLWGLWGNLGSDQLISPILLLMLMLAFTFMLVLMLMLMLILLIGSFKVSPRTGSVLLCPPLLCYRLRWLGSVFGTMQTANICTKSELVMNLNIFFKTLMLSLSKRGITLSDTFSVTCDCE